MKLRIYTDGACSGNPGAGGAASITFLDKTEYEEDHIIFTYITDSREVTTNQRMELLAILNALEHAKTYNLQETDSIELYSDSAYCINAFNQKWIASWLKNGWVNAKKQPVANQDLWKDIVKITNELKPAIKWIKVNGHSDNKWNNYVDHLAVKAKNEQVKKMVTTDFIMGEEF